VPNFDVELFEEMIRERGRDFTWERAKRCPCFVPRLRSAREDCPLCFGLGHQYTLQEGTYRATLLSITGDRRYAKMGEWIMGDMSMTFESSLGIGDMDRITMIGGDEHGKHRGSDLLIRGTKDKLIDRGVYELIEVSDEVTAYTADLDFRLVDGEVVWTGQQPAVGTVYTVLYWARPVYVVFMTLSQDRTPVPSVAADGSAVERVMPRKVALRLWIDFVRGDNAA
jgi:hypothetical protein